jgi:hypothetical protein
MRKREEVDSSFKKEKSCTCQPSAIMGGKMTAPRSLFKDFPKGGRRVSSDFNGLTCSMVFAIMR